MTPSRDLATLLAIMAALRTPGTGCPWDLEQNFETIAPYTIEEAYEVTDAIARGDLDDLREELGDLLLQVVFHARMAQEQEAFDFGDVVQVADREADPAAPARVRSDRRHDAGGGQRTVGRDQGAGEGREGAPAWPPGGPAGARRCAGRSAGGAPCPDPGVEAPGQGRTRRVRLERSARRAGEDPRGSRRDRSRDRVRRPEQGRSRGRRSAVCRGQSGAASRRRSGGRAARHQPQVRATFRVDRGCTGGARQDAGRLVAGRDGRALGQAKAAEATAEAIPIAERRFGFLRTRGRQSRSRIWRRGSPPRRNGGIFAIDPDLRPATC